MAAHCEACGGHVMPYRTYAFWMKRTARCEECGSHVRLRHFWSVVGLGMGLMAVTVGVLTTLPMPGTGIVVIAAMTAALLALDYASYHVLTWELDPALDVEEGFAALLSPPNEG
jgi:hypothetical protein